MSVNPTPGVEEKAERLQELLLHWKQHRSRSRAAALSGMVSLLLSFMEQLSELGKQMYEIASDLQEVDLLKSIPSIGDKLAAAIVAEIGDVNQFENAKQRVAYAGLDPAIYSSGKFTAANSRLQNEVPKGLDVHCI